MSQSITLARPYARAAWLAARDGGGIAQWSETLALAARLAAAPAMARVLGDPRLRREDAVGLLARENASETQRSFLRLLADNGRMNLLPEIAGLFEQFRANEQKIVRAKITSAVPMASGELASLVAALKRRFGREVEVETAVDASLIGGALIDTGDVVIDGTLKGKLARLEAALAQ